MPLWAAENLRESRKEIQWLFWWILHHRSLWTQNSTQVHWWLEMQIAIQCLHDSCSSLFLSLNLSLKLKLNCLSECSVSSFMPYLFLKAINKRKDSKHASCPLLFVVCSNVQSIRHEWANSSALSFLSSNFFSILLFSFLWI